MTEATIVHVPAGNGNGEAMSIDMDYWGALEQRINEIAAVTPQKAGELMATFNRAALDLDRMANQLELEYQKSVRESERIKGECLLDRIPTILKAKGLVTDRNPLGSEDLRNAVLSQDKEYQDALERSDFLKAISKVIKGKYEAFDRAFRSVRTLVGEQSYNFLPNRNLSGDTGTAEPGAKPTVAGFGTPRYGR